eukprot:scaffold146_cov171-Ochromonas_danica.AAC.28
MINEDQRAILRLGCQWVLEAADDNELKKYVSKSEEIIRQELKDIEVLALPSLIDDPSLERIREVCQAYGKHFIDKDFPPTATALHGKLSPSSSSSSPGEQGEQQSTTTPHNAPIIEWRRPYEFFKGEYTLFHDGITADDIKQGALGDCWFLSALAALTEFPAMIEALFPLNQPTTTSNFQKEVGAYLVRFYKNGKQRDVLLDDYFPCYPGAGPIYSRAHGPELWVLLAEKAYAKVHGSYSAIRAGWAYEAMMDLTGAPCLTYRFEDDVVKNKIATGEFWANLLRYDLENFLMSASTPGEDTLSETNQRVKSSDMGLIAGHAYTLISVRTSSKGDRLLKLRNPWGSVEWTGDWSDTSPLWTAEMQAEIEPLALADDGTFWMSFDDLLRHFVSINVCMTRLPGLNKKPWKDSRRQFFFDYCPIDDESPQATAQLAEEGTAYTPSITSTRYRVISPSYLLTLSQRGTVIVSIHQEDIRCANARPYLDIGVTILKSDPAHGTFQLLSGTGNATERQNQTEELELDAGKYIIVPTSSGCQFKAYLANQKKDGNTIQDRAVLTKTEGNGDVVFSDAVIAAYSALFQRMDNDGDGVLSKAEMDQYMLRTEGATIEDSAFTWLLHNFETKEAQGLSLPGFLRAQLYVFKQSGSDEEKLWKEFKLLGYDDQLVLQACRSAVIAVHSTAEFTLDSLPYDEAAAEEAEELVILQRGELKTFEGGLIKLYKLRSGSSGVSLMVENLNHRNLVFQMDCSGSVNVISHRQSLVHKEVVPPNERKVLHHLMPSDPRAKAWSWSYSASYFWDT